MPDPDATWTDDDARTVLAAWRRTKQPLGTFARENGLVANRLYWWRKRLSEPARPVELEFVPAVELEFVPAVITSDAGPEAPTILVRMASNVTIEIANASPRTIAEIVSELARTL